MEVPSYEEVMADKMAYARANQVEYEEHDPVRGKAILQKHGDRWLVTNPPQPCPCPPRSWIACAELPYVREPHPMYDAMGGVPAIEEVRFSVTHNRGCFGGLQLLLPGLSPGADDHLPQPRERDPRGRQRLTHHPGFKGYIHDVGGPYRQLPPPMPVKKQLKAGAVPEPGLPGAQALSQPGCGRDRLSDAAAEAADDPGHQKDLHPLRHPL